MKASIIIRTKNEERWITSCLNAVFAQNYQDFEVIIVDNQSTDSTLAKVDQFPVKKVVHCTEYLPGKSLNIGIAEASGEFVVCLSGHCIPTNDQWLSNLLRNMADPNIAGVYGRQEPLSFTPPGDKRDLMIVFGPERKVQRKDSFFHNANSMVRKSVLDQIPFDDKITNIEDRVWAQQVLQQGHAIIYEPEASVYHWHGIHQDGNIERCQNVVRILESLDSRVFDASHRLSLEHLNIVAMIPIKGSSKRLGGAPLLEYTINSALQSRYISSVVVSADNKETAKSALSMGAHHAILRDTSLSQDYVGLEKVYRYTLEQLAAKDNHPDVLVLLEITYPFREKPLIDDMIDKLVAEGLDSVLPAKIENNPIWIEEEKGIRRIDEGFIPRQYKKAIYLGYKGLCCVTRPEFIRTEEVVGANIGVYTIGNPYSCLEIRNDRDLELPGAMLRNLRLSKTIKPDLRLKRCGNE
ncbi:MAG: glycosyltransferase family 2 protein [Proteobacteria bacterium]|nr:glycosyltransferase family 2 protein [Desulfobulbaceae bacterium]MBU4153817.1 glycosyltransferase family 2 protein [Pseudomonadota bacterium]